MRRSGRWRTSKRRVHRVFWQHVLPEASCQEWAQSTPSSSSQAHVPFLPARQRLPFSLRSALLPGLNQRPLCMPPLQSFSESLCHLMPASWPCRRRLPCWRQTSLRPPSPWRHRGCSGGTRGLWPRRARCWASRQGPTSNCSMVSAHSGRSNQGLPFYFHPSTLRLSNHSQRKALEKRAGGRQGNCLPLAS